MKKSRYPEQQISFIQKQADAREIDELLHRRLNRCHQTAYDHTGMRNSPGREARRVARSFAVAVMADFWNFLFRFNQGEK